MIHLFMTLVVVAAGPKAPPKLDPITKPDAPKLDIKLPDMPKANGLARPASNDEEPTLKRSATEKPGEAVKANGSTAKVESIIHARDFQMVGGKRRAAVTIDGFDMASFPAKVSPFKSLIKVVSSDGGPVTLKTEILSPGGDLVLSSHADVVFSGTQFVEVLIEWAGFEAVRPGDYKILTLLDGRPGGEFALPIRGKGGQKKSTTK